MNYKRNAGTPEPHEQTLDLTPKGGDQSVRIWRFSGFDDAGNAIEYEFAGPSGATQSVVFKPSILVGRDPERCDFVVSDRSISRIHAMLRYDLIDGLTVMDMGSGNGTFVDGQRVGSDFVPLHLGSELTLGQVHLKVSYRR